MDTTSTREYWIGGDTDSDDGYEVLIYPNPPGPGARDEGQGQLPIRMKTNTNYNHKLNYASNTNQVKKEQDEGA